MKFWIFIIIGLLIVWILVKRTSIMSFFATVKFTRGATAESLRIFENAENLGRLSANSKMTYGYILLREGMCEKSKAILTEASMEAKNLALKRQIKSILALSVWKDGDLDGAIEMMEELMGEFKTSTAYQNLGLMYIVKGDGEKALEFNLKAYEYNSGDLVIADNLAESYVLCGETEKAKELYEAILEKSPAFPEPYYNYGQILVREGERERGISLIKESLDKRFTFLSVKTKEEVEEMLKQIEKK